LDQSFFFPEKPTPKVFTSVAVWDGTEPVTYSTTETDLFGHQNVDPLACDAGVFRSPVALAATCFTSREPPLGHHPEMLGHPNVGDV